MLQKAPKFVKIATMVIFNCENKLRVSVRFRIYDDARDRACNLKLAPLLFFSGFALFFCNFDEKERRTMRIFKNNGSHFYDI